LKSASFEGEEKANGTSHSHISQISTLQLQTLEP